MLTKVYFGLCGVVLAAAALIAITGNMTQLTLVVFGFVAFGLTFMGMMGVLPTAVSHPSKAEAPLKPVRVSAPAKITANVGGAIASLLDPRGIEIHRHRHP